MSGWEPNEVEHTFGEGAGRTFTIRRSLPLQWLLMRAIESDDPELAAGISEWFDKGTLEDSGVDDQRTQLHLAARIERAVVEAMFIRPRVWWNPEEMPDAPPPPDGEPPFHLSAADMTDAELSEVLEIAFKGVAEATRFRDDPAGPQRGKGGKGVAPKPKPGARPRAGKR
ncbi:MAG: hypothetical protein H0W82_00040 [Actinobacteria bacterium]|nr:hypothetical protein [Actinomycetota bacterium]